VGAFLELEGNRTLGREESRAVRRLPFRDFCKLHIILHYVAVLLGKRVSVLPIGKVGDDAEGRDARALMAKAGMDVSLVAVERGVPTLFSWCFLYPDGTGGNLTTADSASSLVTPAFISRARARLAKHRERGVIVTTPEVPPAARLTLLRLGSRFGFFRAAALTSAETDFARRPEVLRNLDLLALNEDEARALAGASSGRDLAGVLQALGRMVSRLNPALRLSVTAGARGAFGFAGGRWEHVPACPARAVNTAGAGDAHLAGLIIARAAGLPFLGEARGSRRFADRPVTNAMDFAGLLASCKTTGKDTIHLSLDARALRAHAATAGARLSPAVAWMLGTK